MTDRMLGYIAGLFDGEGHCRVQQYKVSKNGLKYLRVRVQITNTHRAVLELVRQQVGAGDITAMHGMELKKNGEPRKPCFNWRVQNKNAVNFLRMVRPLLVIKAATVDEIFAGRMSGRA